MVGDIITTDKDVLTSPMWLYDLLNGTKHPTKSAELIATIDPDGDPIMSMEVLDDPDWDYLGEEDINGKPLRDWLTVKKYKYIETE